MDLTVKNSATVRAGASMTERALAASGVAAVAAGLLVPELATDALRNSYRVVGDLARHGYDLSKWAESIGATISWREKPRASPS